MILSREARILCIFAVTGGDFTGSYRFLKGIHGLADIPTIFQEKIDQTLINEHQTWLDDIIIETKGSKEKHKKELIEVLTRLENAGYRLRENKYEFFESEIDRIGHKIDQNGIRPLQDKLIATKNLKQPNNGNELKTVLAAIQYLSKYIDNLSTQTDNLRQLLKKDNDCIWTEDHTQAFENLKQKITEIPCLAHYNSDYPECNNNQRQYERPRCNTLAKTTRRKIRTDRVRLSIFRITGCSLGIRTLPIIYLR